ncbi:hypothetical protein [Mesorhizobium sp. AR07]|uniref:hypothetical protein n=1 Tax=Mesorhizobium sp. AR07 TaxID=2865838 RepID=UPI0029E7E1C6|nr:hypothetical protein [Mesorhizobium sp. AR07]
MADFNDHVMKVGLAGGTLACRDQEPTLYRSGKPEHSLWSGPIAGQVEPGERDRVWIKGDSAENSNAAFDRKFTSLQPKDRTICRNGNGAVFRRDRRCHGAGESPL